MEQLRYVASRGTTVICTTHLMDNVRLLDMVIVLGVVDGVGQIGYVGPPSEVLDHFECRNFADLYDKLAAGRFCPVTAVPVKQASLGPEQQSARPSPALHGVSLVKPLSDSKQQLTFQPNSDQRTGCSGNRRRRVEAVVDCGLASPVGNLA